MVGAIHGWVEAVVFCECNYLYVVFSEMAGKEIGGYSPPKSTIILFVFIRFC